MDPIEELLAALRTGDLVLFVGDGISSAMGLPSYERLLRIIVEHARARGMGEADVLEIAELGSKQHFIDALSAARDLLGPHEFCNIVEYHLDDRAVDVPDVARSIALLAPQLRAVLTTRLDHVLERAFDGRWPALARATADVGQRRGVILKLHGTLYERSTWMVTRDDYDRAMHLDPRFRDAFATIFRSRTLLFVGYRPGDDDFERLLSSVRSISGDQPPRHFALVPSDAVMAYRRKRLEAGGVTVLPFLDPDGSYTEAATMIREIAAMASGNSMPVVQVAPPPAVGWTPIAGFRPDPRTLALHGRVEPRYASGRSRALSEELEATRARRRALRQRGFATTKLDDEILRLRRQLRDGGRLQAGDSLGDGRYLLLDRLGQGGFAVVWSAHDRNREASVAIKVLHNNLVGDPQRLERFRRGARRMAELNHEGIVRVLDEYGEDEGYHYFVMDFVPGGDLRGAVLQGRLNHDEINRIILRVGEALAHAHRMGMVHRDVKPANILLDASGAPRLTDFDLVGAADSTGGTRTGALGTFVYTAPECLHHPQDADATADVYGLGMTAVFCLHGSELPMDVVRDSDTFIDRLPFDWTMRAVLKRAVHWSKDARFPSLEQFCETLKEALLQPGGFDPASAGAAFRDRDSRLELGTRLEEANRQVEALRSDVVQYERWLTHLEEEVDWLRAELQKRPKVTRKTYKILTIGINTVGKTSLTLKWSNPLVDLGTIQGTKIERYERTVSQVVSDKLTTEHVFEIGDWGGEYMVDAQHEFAVDEIHGLLFVVDLGAKDAKAVEPGRVQQQLLEFQGGVLKFFFSSKAEAICKTVVLFINKSDLLPGMPAEAEAHGKQLYAPLIDEFMKRAGAIDFRVFVGSASYGHNTHHLFAHFVEKILPRNAYDAQLLQRLKSG